MALETEAKPTIENLGLSTPKLLAAPMPFLLHAGTVDDAEIQLVTLGNDPATGVQLVGTQPAAVACDLICRKLKPDVIINAGTAGGFISRGGQIGKLYLCGGPFFFHDRRIALPGYGAYGEGSYQTSNVDTLCEQLGFESGITSSGDSLDMVDADADRIHRFEATAKDMEAAAIAWVTTQHGIPLVALKSITDLVDGEHPTEVEFLANLEAASHSLGEGLIRLVRALATASPGTLNTAKA